MTTNITLTASVVASHSLNLAETHSLVGLYTEKSDNLHLNGDYHKMNDAVNRFKRYEDSSLEYTGIDRHSGTVAGLWDTAIDTSKVGQAEGRVVDNPVSSPDNDWSTDSDGDHSMLSYEPSSLEETSYGHTDNHSEYVEDSSSRDKCLPRKPWDGLQAGDSVTHKSLGPGTVIFIDDNYLTVRFSDRESKFRFPSAFEKGYLSV